MKTECLCKGMIIPNYKEMCNLLDEKINAGNSKKSQLEEWGRYFNYEKIGNKFHISEIYSKPKPKMSNALYVKFIELLLMYELSTKECFTCNYTKTNLFFTLGMANYNYLKSNRFLVSNQIAHIPNWQTNHFYMRSNQKLTDILFSALNSMKRRKLLSYYEQRIIVQENNSWMASDDEEKLILRIEREVLQEMGCEKIPIFKIDEYYANVNAKLFDTYGWSFAYKEYKLIFNSDQIQDDIPTVKNEFMAIVQKNKLELNVNILEAIDKQAEYYYNKNHEQAKQSFQELVKQGWITDEMIMNEGIKKMSGFIYPEDYIENQKFLAGMFIAIQ